METPEGQGSPCQCCDRAEKSRVWRSLPNRLLWPLVAVHLWIHGEMAVWEDWFLVLRKEAPSPPPPPPPFMACGWISLIVHLCISACAARWGSHRTVVFAQSLELPVDPWRPGDSPMFRWKKPGPRKVKQLAPETAADLASAPCVGNGHARV